MNSRFANQVISLLASLAVGAGLLMGGGTSLAQASATQLVAKVSLSRQVMEVVVDGRLVFEWRVSTGARGHRTPTGSWQPTRMHRMWYSRQYDNAPMPFTVFFHEGYAVHATPHVGNLGRPASHGCVRLHPSDAQDFYQLVGIFGPENTHIVVAD